MLRAPLALLFLQENTSIRVAAVILSMLTDWLDGFLARKFNMVSETGKFLDPMMDKFFAFFVLAVLASEKILLPWQMASMLARDFFLALFGIFVGCFGSWRKYECESIWMSKVVTALQFVIIIGLSIGYKFGNHVYLGFIGLASLSIVELAWGYRKKS